MTQKAEEHDNAMTKKVRIDRTYPEDLQSHFVSNLVVQHQPEYFVLQFFEVWPPPIFGESDEERTEAMNAIENVEAKCVARLVLTPSKMNEVVQAMSQNLAKYKASREKKSRSK